jgi:hypothetical protein
MAASLPRVYRFREDLYEGHLLLTNSSGICTGLKKEPEAHLRFTDLK